MAERRMFAKTIIDSDAFLDMPLSTQSLYFHLSMRGDDEGFVNNPKKIQRMIGASDDDLKLLIAKNFIITFETGVVVIKHWKIHNYIREDRLQPTVYADERAMLEVKESGAYTLDGQVTDKCQTSVRHLSDKCQASDRQMSDKCQTSVSIGKDSIDKDSIGKDIERKHFVPPSVEEVKAYIEEKGYSINPDSFVDYYTSNGWHVGRNKMKDWKDCVRSWNNREKKPTKPSSQIGRAENYDDDTMKKMLLSSL